MIWLDKYNLTRTTDAAAEPVSLADMKTHLRVDHTDEDAYITALITSARMMVEEYTLRALITQTWLLTADAFYDTDLVMPRSPLAGITHVKYYNSSSVLTTVTATDYWAFTTGPRGRLVLKADKSWPSDVESNGRPDAVQITFTAGYGASASYIPAALVHAVKLLCHWQYDQRMPVNVGNIVNELPWSAAQLIAPYRLHYIA